ncbi:MAG: hypothetical protein ACT4P5_21655 [Armatimonadota bacterium]
MKHARIVVGATALDAQVDGEWVITADGGRLGLPEVVFAPPCVPTKIVCVGFNYRDHADELGWEAPRRGPLASGDVVEIEIAGIGVLRNTVAP